VLEGNRGRCADDAKQTGSGFAGGGGGKTTGGLEDLRAAELRGGTICGDQMTVGVKKNRDARNGYSARVLFNPKGGEL